MRNNTLLTKITASLFVLALFILPKASYADWQDQHDRDHHERDHHDGGHYYRYHDHPHYGLHLHYLPDGYLSVWVGGVRYYYYDGVYYNYYGGDYVVIAPPRGAVVTAIPSDFHPVIINGTTYYVDNGAYYLYTPHGYQVAVPPVVEPLPAHQVFFTVNVPNRRGGYSAVVIKRSGDGYVGPQGEFYREFPKVVQLKVMYDR